MMMKIGMSFPIVDTIWTMLPTFDPSMFTKAMIATTPTAMGIIRCSDVYSDAC